MKTILLTLFFLSMQIQAQNSAYPYDTIAINNIFAWIGADGYDSYDPRADNNGLYWRVNDSTYMPCVYTEGLQWGGLVDNKITIGGTFYFKSNTPVRIDSAYPNHPGVWKIRKDWKSFPDGETKNRLKYDYDNWPVDLGAPWVDVNGDGKFTRGIDKPEFPGDEVLFSAYFMSDSSRFLNVFQTQAFNIEIHETVYGFDSNDFLKGVIFKKYQIINKDSAAIKDFYAAYWSDNDFGNPEDDFAGCDSSLFLAYSFNFLTEDQYLQPLNGAMGHVILDGLKKDGQNLMMSAFNVSYKNTSISHDPSDSTEYFNMVQGLVFNGENYINPVNNSITNFPFNGNPVTGDGWHEGGVSPNYDLFGNDNTVPGDRRYYLISGPVELAPGDTQSITIAEMVSIGETNLSAITELKKLAEKVQVFYGNDFVVNAGKYVKNNIPLKYKLYQNYPNPFNPTTVIKYSIPSVETRRVSSLQRVTLKIYDILGRVVATPVNEKQSPGNYEVKFNASNLSSGVYIYRLKIINGFNTMTQTRKMILLK